MARTKKMKKRSSQGEVITAQTTYGQYGFPADWPLTNPDEVLRKLGSTQEVYSSLMYDPRVESTVSQRKAKVKKLKWELIRNDAKAREVKICKKMMNNIPIYDVIDEAFESRLYGFKVFEVVWTKHEDLLWPSLHGKPVEYFFFNQGRELRWNKAGDFPKGSALPSGHYILVRNGATYKNPYGNALLARVYWWVTFKRDLMRYWNLQTLRFGADGMYVQHDFADGSPEHNQVVEGLKSMMKQYVGQFPQDCQIGTITTASKNAGDLYRSAIEYCDRMIGEAILTQALTQDTGQGGSYAKLAVGQENEYNVSDSDCQEVYEPTFNALIDLIYEMNFDSEEHPSFYLYDENYVNAAILERDIKMKSNFGAKFTKEHFMKTQMLDEKEFELDDNAETKTMVIGGGRQKEEQIPKTKPKPMPTATQRVTSFFISEAA